MSADQGEEEPWPITMDSDSEGEGNDEAAAAATSTTTTVAAGADAAISGALTSDSVGAWLQEWASGPDSALLAGGGGYRFVRQQVLAIAKRIAAVADREKRNQQRRRYQAEMERQRSSTDLLPPNEITTGTMQARAIMAPANSDAVVAVASGGSGSNSAAASGSGSTAVSVSGVAAGGGAALWRREPRAPKAPKPHLRPDAAVPTNQMNRHQLQDVTRTVRQLRHLNAHRCYVCKAPLNEEQGGQRHHSFTNHCHSCGEQNAAKRHALVDLRGRIAVLTGARIKIGYQIGVRLLRCGATLLATSRFPANALLRYQSEPDYDSWKSNLHLLYADLCNPAEVRALADRIKAQVPHVDILINNAAQTVRRPLPYYEQLNRIEMQSQQRLLQTAQDAHTPFSIQPHTHARTQEATAAPSAAAALPALSAHAPPVAAVAAPAAAPVAGPPCADAAAPSSGAAAAAAPLCADASAPPSVPTATAPTAGDVRVQPEDAHESDGADAEIEVPAAAAKSVTSSSAAGPQQSAAAPASSGAVIDATHAAELSVRSRSDPDSTALSSLLSSPSAAASLPALHTLSVQGAGFVEVPQRRFSPFSLIPSLDVMGAAEAAALFPAGRVDTTNDHEPLDLRASNSWNMRSDEVDPRELAEVLSTNAMAPFVLAQQLRPHMRRSPHPARYLVLVSSMEGKLNRSKVDMHVHTNMAKASLNAFTRTAAAEFAAENIYMNSVDTGWNSEERAVNDPKRSPEFETPLDCADGAARVLDPIFVGETEKRYIFGQFLKDYAPGDW